MYIRSKEWWLMVLAVDWLVCSLCVVSAKGSTGCLLIARLASYRNVHDAKLVYSRLFLTSPPSGTAVDDCGSSHYGRLSY